MHLQSLSNFWGAYQTPAFKLLHIFIKDIIFYLPSVFFYVIISFVIEIVLMEENNYICFITTALWSSG